MRYAAMEILEIEDDVGPRWSLRLPYYTDFSDAQEELDRHRHDVVGKYVVLDKK